MLVHAKRMSAQDLPVPIISVDGGNLTPQPAIRNLGISINSVLSVDDHVGMLCKSLAYHIRLIAGVRKFLGRQLRKNPYCSNICF